MGAGGAGAEAGTGAGGDRAGGSVLASEFDLDKYVVGKTLDGLFYMLGEEEKKIRKNPAAQTTELLKEVFGRK